MKTYFKIFLIALIMSMCSNPLLAFERISNAELATLYGGDWWGCDADCLDGTGGCPDRTTCEVDLRPCRMCDFAQNNEYCGNWQWQWIGIQCSSSSISCPTGGRIGYCSGPDCVGDPAQQNPPDCTGNYTDC